MKKIGKKLCNFTKVFLVFCLLFSNLSSLKVVFAYDGTDEIVPETSLEEKEEIISEDVLNEDEDKEETILEDIQDEEETLEEEIDEENVGAVVDDEDEEETPTIATGEGTNENEQEGEEAPNEEQIIEDYTDTLNNSGEGLGLSGKYLFADKEGTEKKLYVVIGVNESEVQNIVNNAYDEALVSVVEDTVTITTDNDEVTYMVIVYNNDYLDRLMKVVIGDGEATLDDDINGDSSVDVYDAATLRLILSDGFGSEVVKQSVKIDAKLDGKTDALTVGDTFKVIYIMTLADYGVDGITGLINYNKDMLTLDKVDVKNFVDGSDYDGKFLYFGDYIMGEEVVTTDSDGNEVITYLPTDYIIVEMTFTAISGGSDKVSVSDIGYFNGSIYYEGNDTLSKDITVISNNNMLSSLTIGGVSVPIDGLTDVYTITVPNDVTKIDLSYVLADPSASVTSIVAPEELAVGENTVKITVVAENGEERTYTITVIREGEEEEESEVVNPVNYEDTTTYGADGNDKETVSVDTEEVNKDESKLSRVIIIILILLAIAGLIYLIFKDDDDEETKKANRDINKFKKEDFSDRKTTKTNNNKKTNKKGR